MKKNNSNKKIKNEMPILLGGVGEKISNGGTQYYLQDRVFDSSGFSTAVTTSFMPWFLVEEDDYDE